MSVRRGEIVGVIGRNGVGKSTLMRCLIGLLDTWRGTITFMDQDVTSLQADARARAGFGYIPQGRDVFPQMSVEENLQVGELIGGPEGKEAAGTGLRVFSAAEGTPAADRRHHVGRRAAATRHRAGADRQSVIDDPGRAVRGHSAVDRAAYLRCAEIVPRANSAPRSSSSSRISTPSWRSPSGATSWKKARSRARWPAMTSTRTMSARNSFCEADRLPRTGLVREGRLV